MTDDVWLTAADTALAVGQALLQQAREAPLELYQSLYPLPPDVALADVVLLLRSVARAELRPRLWFHAHVCGACFLIFRE